MTDQQRPFEPTLYARDYRTALAALGTAVANEFRLPAAEAKDDQPLVLDPHELRAAAAAAAGILDDLHGLVAGIAFNAGAALAEDGALPWVDVDPVTADEVAHANEPNEFQPAPNTPVTELDLVIGRAAQMAEDVRDRATDVAVLVAEAAILSRELLDSLRRLTTLEWFDADSGRRVNCFHGLEGFWTYDRIMDPETNTPRIQTLDQIPAEKIVRRPRPIEERGTELVESVLEAEAYTRVLELPDPNVLPDPAEHGWTPMPETTRPAGATQINPKTGLSRTWVSPHNHTLTIFWVSPTRITDVRFDNERIPAKLPVVALMITEGANLP